MFYIDYLLVDQKNAVIEFFYRFSISCAICSCFLLAYDVYYERLRCIELQRQFEENDREYNRECDRESDRHKELIKKYDRIIAEYDEKYKKHRKMIGENYYESQYNEIIKECKMMLNRNFNESND